MFSLSVASLVFLIGSCSLPTVVSQLDFQQSSKSTNLLEGRARDNAWHVLNFTKTDCRKLPHTEPFVFKERQTNFYNFAAVNLDELAIDTPWPNASLIGRHYVAIGGAVDANGNTVSHSTGFIGLRPRSPSRGFYVDRFNFFCLDKAHQSVACDIGVMQGWDSGPEHDDIDPFTSPIQVYHTEAYSITTVVLASPMLKLFAIGLNLAPFAGISDDGYAKWDADQLYGQSFPDITDRTLYITNITFRSTYCDDWTPVPVMDGKLERIASLQNGRGGCPVNSW